MKKLLSIFWVIIIAGIIFIGLHYLRPDAKEELLPEQTEENVTIEQQPVELDDEITKTFDQYIQDAKAHLETGYPEKAITSYKKALGINPKSAETLAALGDAYLENNEPAKAKEAYAAAVEIEPDSEFYKLSLAKAYLNGREIETAKEIIWSLPETNPLARYYQGVIAILYQNFETAKNIFAKLAAENSIAPTEIVEMSKKYLEAFETYSYYRESDQIYLELLLAKVMTETGEYEAAIPLLFNIIEEKNNYRDAWLVLGFSYLNIGKPLDAIDALTQAKDLNPKNSKTLFFLGLAYFANDNIDEAIYYIEAADKAGYEPKENINLKLGDLYLLKENFQKAASKYEAILLTNTANIGIFVRAVWLNIDKLNKPEKALILALKALETHPENSMSYNLTGWAYTAIGNYNKGKEYLEIALNMNPGLDAANLNLGWLYEKQNRTALAKEYYKKAYIFGDGNSIGNLAAMRFNRITEAELQKYYTVDISAP